MKLGILALGAVTFSSTAFAQVYVHGYTTKNGTYVAPHYRSAPDHNPYNNWSTIGNVNPYTGQAGTRNPYSSYSSPYGSSSQGRSQAYGGSSYQPSPSYQQQSYGCTYYCNSNQQQDTDSDPY